MSRARRACEPLLPVEERSPEYRFGVTLVECIRRVAQAVAGKQLTMPAGEEFQQALYNIGKFWLSMKVSPVFVAERFIARYKLQIEVRQFRLSWLHVGEAANKVKQDIMRGMAEAKQNHYTNPDAPPGMEEAVYSINSSLSYARALLRGARIRLDDQAEVTSWLRLKIGSINPVAACILSNYDPVCVALYKEELEEEMTFRPATKDYLISKGMPAHLLP